MKQNKTAQDKIRTLLDRLESFFSSWRFPILTLSILFFFVLLIIGISLIPVSDTGIGAFAEDFKTWCLGYDPATGEMESIYLVMFIVQPVILGLFIGMFWLEPLSRVLKTEPRKVVPPMLSGLAIVLLIGTAFTALYTPAPDGELPFPADKIRTHLDPPSFTLVNQDKKEISLSDFREGVVMITAIYASCAETCPIILEQARRVLNRLSERDSKQVYLLAITMDPDKDTPGMLKMVADHYELTGPNQHLLTGHPKHIETILDRLNIPRKRGRNGNIEHANIFLLVDKAGYIAYRFTIGDRQEKWLLKATRQLVSESVSGSERQADHPVEATTQL